MSNQNSADESLTSIAHVPSKEVKVVLELKRIVEASPWGLPNIMYSSPLVSRAVKMPRRLALS